MSEKRRTEISELGEFALIDKLTAKFSAKQSSTLKGVGDDAAIIDAGDGEVLVVSTDSLLEGVEAPTLLT